MNGELLKWQSRDEGLVVFGNLAEAVFQDVVQNCVIDIEPNIFIKLALKEDSHDQSHKVWLQHKRLEVTQDVNLVLKVDLPQGIVQIKSVRNHKYSPKLQFSLVIVLL